MIRVALLLFATLLPVMARAEGPFDPFDVAQIIERPGARVPLDLPLRDAEGKATTLRALGAGKPILLIPVLHTCPNFCGITLARLAEAAEGQRYRPGADVTLLAFGIDPAEMPEDAAANLARLRDERDGKAAPFQAALVGPATSVRGTMDALGYRYAFDPRIGQYAHVAASAMLTADGRLVRWIYGLDPEPAVIEKAVADAREGRTGGLVDRLILLCYHFDPETGRYTLAIERAVRIAGLTTVLLLACLLLKLARRRA
ncbi:SCO family protein [Pedomonas mirosovicensis]|uniref:SCO family protein n=1 Tax=Pedomonas mirosovicensis TaxID=2908641 RepID=UPI0021697A66|nr:SCO family protein [Pedomonas mirosovicensis]MCH8686708.1 SCO family protein [Pedomonas mirosovicensis]